MRKQYENLMDPKAELFLSYAPFVAGTLGCILAIALAVIGCILGR